MAAATETAQEKLARIKKNISTSYTYFKDNYTRFRDFRRYVFKESVTQKQRAMLQQLGRPIVESNILEAYISRLLGEFAKHEPSIEVSPSEGIPVQQPIIDLVEGHIRHIFHTANKDSFSYESYKDSLSGGFAVAKVWTDYANSMSFDQQIYLGRVFDPTMAGFDPMARAPHKGDGQFSFEIYPMTEEDFKRQFPDVEISAIGYMRDIEGFNWSYRDDKNQRIILVADYFEKKKRKTKIVKLADGRSMTLKNYNKMQAYWQEQQFIEQIPAVIGKPRTTELETVVRFKLIESEIIEEIETDYSYLPHVFIDGNSVLLTEGASNCTYQMTRPYVYQARGVQDLKNFSMQCTANGLENLIQHKFILKKEAIPQEQDFIEALNDIQRANTIVVNAYSENNPDKPIPDPIREVINQPLPPEVMGAYQVADQTTQTILGSYASNLGQNDNDLSGKAIIESASVGNAAAMPYVVSYLAALTQIGNIIVDLMPKYLVGKRTIPVVKMDGERVHQAINSSHDTMLNYAERAINVNIDAGVNFQVQKNQALQQIIALSGASQEFSAFINSEIGLPILVDNLTIYGADRLKEAAKQWESVKQQKQQEAQQQAQQAMMQDPNMVRAQAEMQKVQVQAQQNEFENQIAIAKQAIEKELADAKILEAESKVTQSQIDSAVRLEEAQTSQVNHSLDAAAKLAEVKSREQEHTHKEHENHRENVRLAHEIHRANKEVKNDE